MASPGATRLTVFLWGAGVGWGGRRVRMVGGDGGTMGEGDIREEVGVTPYG